MKASLALTGVFLLISTYYLFPPGIIPQSNPPNKPQVSHPSKCGSCSHTKYQDPSLTQEEITNLLVGWKKQNWQGGEYVEKLLYYQSQIEPQLDKFRSLLPPTQLEFLQREMKRQTVEIEIRAIDQQGNIYAHLKPQQVPLGVKQHLQVTPSTSLQPHEFNGTVKRVGKDHLWVRM